MNFNFTSQICTTKEQSGKLIALGLKKETADMYYFWVGGNEYRLKVDIDNNPLKYNMDRTFIPAWSLHRLIEMYTEHYVCEHINLKLLTYDTIIENIRLDILTGTFNKEYLE